MKQRLLSILLVFFMALSFTPPFLSTADATNRTWQSERGANLSSASMNGNKGDVVLLGNLEKSEESINADESLLSSVPDEIADMPFKIYEDHRYVCIDQSMTWTEAKAQCEEWNGHLVTITSQEEQDTVADLISGGSKRQYWIGLEMTSGSPLWVTGEPYSYTNWDRLEPHSHSRSDGQRELYGQIYNIENPATSGSRRFAWNDMYIDNTYPGEENNFSLQYVGFVCEFEPNAVPPDPADIECTSGTFHYFSNQLAKRNLIKVKDEVAEYTFDYNEGWFEKSSSQYQHDLAKMSLRMAMAGMARINIDAPTDTTNIRELFTKLKFSNVECEYPEPEENSIGYAIGSKNIRGSDGKEYSLVAVVVRSAGYQEEWGGNVTLGPSGNHKGFQTAADKLLNGLKSGGGIRDESGVFNYVSRLQQAGLLTENVKIWITGYSRGAAVANLAAAKLNKEYGKANVFAYSFECPQGAYGESAEGESYNNIFSIVNPIDLVTKVAMSEWNFTRYGKTYYLPSLSNTVKYLPLKVKMEQEYAKLLKYNGGSNADQGVKSVTRELAGIPGLLDQSAVFDRFVTNIARNMGSRSVYYNLHERSFSTAIAHLEDMSESREMTEEDILAIFGLLGMEMTGKTVIVSLSPALQMLAMAEVEVEAFALATCMQYAHFPELCLAWLEALDGETICNLLTGYRTVIINCPVDVSVYDADHRLVAQIQNDTPQELENGVSAYVDLNGQKIVILPCDMEYSLNVKATDNGTVTYTVADYDMDKGAYTQVVSYQDLPVQKNDVLVCVAPEESADTTVSYALTTEDGEKIAPDVKQQGDAVQLWNVRVDAEEGGTAAGSGAFLCGEYARVSAEAESGYRFLGWFEGKKKVSEDAEYRFAVEKDTALTARFERTAPPPSNPFTDVKESAYYFEPVLWAVNHVPQITNGTGDKTFSPEWECQRCQIVTFLWRAMGCPEPTSMNNPFVDVKPSDYFYKAVLWAVEKGITNGMDATHFGPNLTCTRGQAVTFLWRAEGRPAPKTKVSDFTDVQNPNDYFYTPVLWAVENNITNGTGNGLFSPNMICLREQIVTFLYRDLA